MGDSKSSYSGGLWPAIICPGSDINAMGVVFQKNLCRTIGRGDSTLFWNDTWLRGASPSSSFSRLYALALNKHCLVQDRISYSDHSLHFS